MPRNRVLLPSLALAAAGLVLTACAGGTADATTDSAEFEPITELSVQNRWVNNVQFAGGFVADEEGFYADQNLTVTTTPGGPGVNVEPLVVQGTADVGLSNPTNTANAIAEGAGLTIIGAIYQSSPSAVISLPDDPMDEPDDLVGKTIGVPAASTAAFVAWLESAGVEESEVEIVPIQFDAAPLISGQVDAISGLATSQGVALTIDGYEPVILHLGDFGPDTMDLTYTVASVDLDDPAKRDALVRYLAAEILGWQAVLADPNAAVDIVLAGPGADLDLNPEQQVQQALMTNDYIEPSADTQVLAMSDELVQETLEALANDGVEADASMFDNSLVEDAFALIGQQ